MKQNTRAKSLAKCQTRKSIIDAVSGDYQLLVRMPSNHGLFNIFLIQNKGKGPPGRTRSPGLNDWLSCEMKFAVFWPLKSNPDKVFKNPIENEFNAFIKIKNLYLN